MKRWLHRLERPLPRAVVVGLAAGVLLVWLAAQRLDRREPDEAAWLYSTVYARFFTGGLPEGAWDNRDAVDHPPVAKYIIGGFAALSGPLRTSLEDKDFWHRFDLDMLHRGPFLKELWRRVDPGALRRARVGGAMATAASSGLLTWLGELLCPGAGVVAGLALALHPLLRHYGCAALADPWFLMLALAALALAVRLGGALRAGAGPGVTAAWAAGLGVTLGLVAGTKLTGLALWAVPAVPVFVHLREDRRNRALLAAALVWGVALLVFLGLNPALWSDPAGRLATMFGHRLDRVELQQMLFELDAIERLPARLWLGLTDPVGYFGPGNPNPFFGGSNTAAMVTVPLFFGLAALGAAGLWRRRGPALLAPVAGLLLLFLPAITGYYLRWPRYLLPALPLWLLLAGVGLAELVGWIRARGWKPSRLAGPAVAALLGLGMAAWHPPALIPGPARAAERESARADLERHYGRIHAVTVVKRARSRLEKGQISDAVELARYGTQLDPDNQDAAELLDRLEKRLDIPPVDGDHVPGGP